MSHGRSLLLPDGHGLSSGRTDLGRRVGPVLVVGIHRPSYRARLVQALAPPVERTSTDGANGGTRNDRASTRRAPTRRRYLGREGGRYVGPSLLREGRVSVQPSLRLLSSVMARTPDPPTGGSVRPRHICRGHRDRGSARRPTEERFERGEAAEGRCGFLGRDVGRYALLR